MRFRFLGGSDAPDWILAEVSILAKMVSQLHSHSSVRMKLICRQVLQQLTGRGLAYDKISKLTSGSRMTLEPGDIKALIATLHFILSQAARHAVDGTTLLLELEQLGLPKDVCTAIVREYGNAKDELRAVLMTKTLSLPQVTELDWRVDYVLASTALQTVDAPFVRLNFRLSKAATASGSAALPVEMTAELFTTLYAELRAARKVMETLQQPS